MALMACNVEKSKSKTFSNTNISSFLYQCCCLSSHSTIRSAISFFPKNARAHCTFYICLAKPLSKVHVTNNSSNTDYDPQDIPLLSRMVNKIGEKLGYRKKLSEKFKRRVSV